jgi:hypothetical protein
MITESQCYYEAMSLSPLTRFVYFSLVMAASESSRLNFSYRIEGRARGVAVCRVANSFRDLLCRLLITTARASFGS